MTQGDDGRAPRHTGTAPGYLHEVLAVVLRVRDGHLEVLLWQRRQAPQAGTWALPGGLLVGDELLGAALARQLAAKVDVHHVAHLEQLETRSDPARDPRGRVLATAYLGLVPCDVEPSVPTDTAWHSVSDMPPSAFDHGSIIESGCARLRAKLSYTNIGHALAADTFTISQLRDVYAAALAHEVSATNLQRVLLRRGALERTDAVEPSSSAGGRPAAVYRFRHRHITVTNEFAAFRPPPPGTC